MMPILALWLIYFIQLTVQIQQSWSKNFTFRFMLKSHTLAIGLVYFIAFPWSILVIIANYVNTIHKDPPNPNGLSLYSWLKQTKRIEDQQPTGALKTNFSWITIRTEPENGSKDSFKFNKSTQRLSYSHAQNKRETRKLTFSLPAKSTRYSFPFTFFCVSTFSCLMWIRNTLWLRELCSFMSREQNGFTNLIIQSIENN